MSPQVPSTFDQLFPIAAVVAIILFVVREILEWRRRTGAEERKVKALKLLLARECELNLWPVDTLKSILSCEPLLEGTQKMQFVRVEKRTNDHVVRMTNDDGLEALRPVSKLHRDNMGKLLLECASLHDELFKKVEKTHDALSEVEHVRDSLIYIHDREGETEVADLFDGLAEYALRELDEARQALKALYLYCTGQELEKARLR